MLIIWDSSVKMNIGNILEMALTGHLVRDYDYLRFQAFSRVYPCYTTLCLLPNGVLKVIVFRGNSVSIILLLCEGVL